MGSLLIVDVGGAAKPNSDLALRDPAQALPALETNDSDAS